MTDLLVTGELTNEGKRMVALCAKLVEKIKPQLAGFSFILAVQKPTPTDGRPDRTGVAWQAEVESPSELHEMLQKISEQL